MDGAEITAMLCERERERQQALVDDDMERFGRLIADDIVHVHTTGMVQGKAELLHHAGSFLRFLGISRSGLQVRPIAPGVAIMTGAMTNTVRRRGVDETVTVDACVTQVWVLRDAGWQIASFQATRLPAQDGR